MKCSNCKHWQHTHTTFKRFGTCQNACKTSKPYAADFISIIAKIETWENFGCIRFEDKRSFLQRIFNTKP